MQSSDSQVQNLVEVAQQNGYDVAVINFRGYAGLKLKTPKMIGFYDTSNFEEPIEYIYNKYCEG
jgi:predicted alpha/beta-fold hydrolase